MHVYSESGDYWVLWIILVVHCCRYHKIALSCQYTLQSEVWGDFPCQGEVFPSISPWMWLPEGDSESATPLSCSSSSLPLLFSFLFLFTLSAGPSQDTPPTQTGNYVSADVSFQTLPPDISTTAEKVMFGCLKCSTEHITSILTIIIERNITVMISIQEVNES